MTKVIELRANDEDREACISILEKTLAAARRGEIRDVAVVTAFTDDQGPGFGFSYHGYGHYAALLAGVSALTFHMNFTRNEGMD